MTKQSIGSFVITVVVLVAFPIVVQAAGAKKPNFIVVYCDNLGYGDIEPFGSTLHRTPNLNRMAREGRKFTHFCVTAGVCTPSRASIMTGCYSQRVGMHLNDRDGWVLRPVSPYGLHPDEVTIAEVLKEQGYATAIVGKWHLGDQPEFLPTRQGFDWFFGVPYSDDMTERVWDQDGSHWPPLPLMENETVIEAPCDRDGLTRRYTERAMQWIAAHQDEPFFLYFPHAMPGSTKTPFSSPAFKGKSKNGPWGDSIEELDWSMGVMLDQLVELGIAENTFVIWTSDNGAPINSDPTDLSRGSNLPLHGRGYTTSEGAFRVPTIVWQPGTVPAGTVCEELATTMDLLPTFAKLAGAAHRQAARSTDTTSRRCCLANRTPTRLMKLSTITIRISCKPFAPVPGKCFSRSLRLPDIRISTRIRSRRPCCSTWSKTLLASTTSPPSIPTSSLGSTDSPNRHAPISVTRTNAAKANARSERPRTFRRVCWSSPHPESARVPLRYGSFRLEPQFTTGE